MDCSKLAETGNNIIPLVVTAILVMCPLVIMCFSKRGRSNTARFLSLFVGMVFVLSLAGFVPTSIVHAEPNCEDTSTTTSTSSSSNTTPSTPAQQKVWQITFNNNSDWDQFSLANWSLDGTETYTATASGGTGTITGNRTDGSSSSNAREMYVFDGVDNVKDAEVRALVTLENPSSVNTQGGFVMRASNIGDPVHQAGVIMWNNVIFSATGNSLVGTFWGNQQAGGPTFQSDDFGGITMKSDVSSVVANGSSATVTVQMLDPNVVAGSSVSIDNVDPSINGFVTVTNVIDAHNFEFATSQTGSWSSGQTSYAFNYKRWMAARVIGDQVTIKHWLPGQVEPAWNDPVFAVTYTLPSTLSNGDPVPTAGKFALLANHLGDGHAVSYSNVTFKSLDP